MRKAYLELLKLVGKAIFLTQEEEEKIQAEIEIQFGLSPARAKRMIDNAVKTGRVSRHTSNVESNLNPDRLLARAKDNVPLDKSAKIVTPRKTKKEAEEMKAVDEILAAQVAPEEKA